MESRRSDKIFNWILHFFVISFFILLIGLIGFLFKNSYSSIQKYGWNFLTSMNWDPVSEDYGALPVIFGTLVSSLLALCIAGPLSIGVALFINEVLPKKLANILSFLVEMLAAIPSVVYGLWGIFVLAPWLRQTLQPALQKYLGFLPLFQGPAYGVGMLCAAFVLAIMITPTISSLCKEVFAAVPSIYREAALALGATRWETLKTAVLKSTRNGIFGALILGLGRALGETMAVTMVIGNRADISTSLFAPSQTMASVIANEYAEAVSDIHLSALTEVGLLLFAVTLVIHLLSRLLMRTTKRRMA